MSERDYSDSPFVNEALAACPWRTTDHMQPGAYNGSTYCIWCEGYVAGAEARMAEHFTARSNEDTDALLREARDLAGEWQNRPVTTKAFGAHILLRRLCIKIENLRAAAYLNGIERDELRDRLRLP